MSEINAPSAASPISAVCAALKALVVDDESLTRTLLCQVLQRAGVDQAQMFSAEDGEEALRIAEAERPGLILLDLLLPKMDGSEVCRRLRHITDYQPYIVMLTARGQLEDRALADALGVDLFIVKPFSPARLIAELNALCAGLR